MLRRPATIIYHYYHNYYYITTATLYNFMLPSRDGTFPLAGMTVFSTRLSVKPLVSLSSPCTHAVNSCKEHGDSLLSYAAALHSHRLKTTLSAPAQHAHLINCRTTVSIIGTMPSLLCSCCLSRVLSLYIFSSQLVTLARRISLHGLFSSQLVTLAP